MLLQSSVTSNGSERRAGQSVCQTGSHDPSRQDAAALSDLSRRLGVLFCKTSFLGPAVVLRGDLKPDTRMPCATAAVRALTSFRDYRCWKWNDDHARRHAFAWSRAPHACGVVDHGRFGLPCSAPPLPACALPVSRRRRGRRLGRRAPLPRRGGGGGPLAR